MFFISLNMADPHFQTVMHLKETFILRKTQYFSSPWSRHNLHQLLIFNVEGETLSHQHVPATSKLFVNCRLDLSGEIQFINLVFHQSSKSNYFIYSLASHTIVQKIILFCVLKRLQFKKLERGNILLFFALHIRIWPNYKLLRSDFPWSNLWMNEYLDKRKLENFARFSISSIFVIIISIMSSLQNIIW